jgi:Activator of Hsp90 ATPase homolog 1-like protein
MNEFKVDSVRCVQYELLITIKANPARVWRGLVDQLSTWWLPDFHMLGTESIVVLEPHAGGRLYEQRGESQLLWYTVLAITPQQSLDLVGHCSADYGGPSTSQLSIRLAAGQGSTQLSIRDASSLQTGWTQLFSEGLKAFVEAVPD